MAEDIKNYRLLHFASLLMQKGIPFCLYRFPGTKEYNLATIKNILSGSNETAFIISPFIAHSKEEQTLLYKANPDFLNDEVIEKITSLPDKEARWASLPEESTKNDYLYRIGQYLAAIQEGTIQKAILSRVRLFNKPPDFDPFVFYKKLAHAWPEIFAYLFFIPEKGLWAGASPELLLIKNGNHYHTTALAGTLPRNGASEYKWRKKEQGEHNLVRQHIEEVFKINNAKLAEQKGPYTFETGRVAHLKTAYTFEVPNEAKLHNILSALHPTPAIGGLPVKESLEIIHNFEGYGREYYCGYLGEIKGDESARLYINLRCMKIGKTKIAIFVGGGISADSNKEEEWEETNQKSLTLLEIIEDIKKHNEII